MMSPENSDDGHDLEETLRMLKPKAADLDVSSVFYQAGYQAAIASQPNSASGGFGRVLIAAMLAGLIVAPISYQAGVSLSQSETIVEINPESQVVAKTTTSEPEAVGLHADRQRDLTDSRESAEQSRLVEFLVGQWIGDSARDGQSNATTLTAFHARTLTSSDGKWPDLSLGMENRYQTYADNPVNSDDNKPLAISDAVGLADSFGGF